MATSDQTAAAPRAVPYRHMLLLHFTLLNIVALGLLAIAWSQGLVERAFHADGTRFAIVIAVVFVAGLAVAAWRVVETSRELERVTAADPGPGSAAARYLARIGGKDGASRQILAAGLRLDLSQRITIVRHLAGSLVFLGLIGTVIGFIIALSGVDASRAGEVDSIAPMVSALIAGMSTALVTTLVGGVLNIWLMANYQLLATGTARLINAIVELGEDRAGA